MESEYRNVADTRKYQTEICWKMRLEEPFVFLRYNKSHIPQLTLVE